MRRGLRTRSGPDGVNSLCCDTKFEIYSNAVGSYTRALRRGVMEPDLNFKNVSPAALRQMNE